INDVLRHTTDGGQTWADFALPADSPVGKNQEYCVLNDLQSVGTGKLDFAAFCPGEGALTNQMSGYLYQTEDDGATWQVHPLPADAAQPGGNTPQPRVMTMLDSSTGWILACDLPADAQYCYDPSVTPKLEHTGDGGQAWTALAALPDSLRMHSDEN